MRYVKRMLCLLCAAALLCGLLTLPAAAETPTQTSISDTETVTQPEPPETVTTQGEPDEGSGIGAAILSTAVPALLFLCAVTFGYLMGKRSKRK